MKKNKIETKKEDKKDKKLGIKEKKIEKKEYPLKTLGGSLNMSSGNTLPFTKKLSTKKSKKK